MLTHLCLFNFLGGASGQTTVVPVPSPGGAGNLDWLGIKAPARRRRKKPEEVEVIRYSDLDALEARAQKLAEVSIAAAIPDEFRALEEDEIEEAEERLLVTMILKYYH